MDKNGTAAPATQWQVFCQLKTKQLVTVAEEFGAELKRRAELELDPITQHFLILANVRLTECRAYLRNVQSAERAKPSAALAPVSQHGAALPGDSQSSPATAGAAEVSLDAFCVCGHVRGNHVTIFGRCGVSRCACEEFAAAPQCRRCKDDPGHEGACRPIADPESGTSSSSPSELQPRGPRGPEAAEGAGEAGRAKKGPVDLAHHLALLKGGAA